MRFISRRLEFEVKVVQTMMLSVIKGFLTAVVAHAHGSLRWADCDFKGYRGRLISKSKSARHSGACL